MTGAETAYAFRPLASANRARSSPISARTRAPLSGPSPGKLVMISASAWASNACTVASARSSTLAHAASSCRSSASACRPIASSTCGRWRICGTRSAPCRRSTSLSMVFLRPAFFSRARSWARVSMAAWHGVGAAARRARATGWKCPRVGGRRRPDSRGSTRADVKSACSPPGFGPRRHPVGRGREPRRPGHRIDGVDGAAGRPQAGDQETTAGLDGHRDGILRTVTVGGKHPNQLVEPCCRVIDASPGQQRSRLVDDGYVVMVAGPVDTAERSHSPHAFSLNMCCGWSQPCRACVSLMEGLNGPTSG